jgi:ubiquitin-protein ligase
MLMLFVIVIDSPCCCTSETQIIIFVGEIVFNFNYPDEPPDFIFANDDEDFHPEIEEIQVGHIMLEIEKSMWNTLMHHFQFFLYM